MNDSNMKDHKTVGGREFSSHIRAGDHGEVVIHFTGEGFGLYGPSVSIETARLLVQDIQAAIQAATPPPSKKERLLQFAGDLRTHGYPCSARIIEEILNEEGDL